MKKTLAFVYLLSFVIISAGCQKAYTAQEVDALLANKMDRQEAYSAKEIDTLLAYKTDKQGVYDVLNQCRNGYGGAVGSGTVTETCNDVCNRFKAVCIRASGHMSAVVKGGMLNTMYYQFNCDQTFGERYSYYKTLVENEGMTQLSTDCLCCTIIDSEPLTIE